MPDIVLILGPIAFQDFEVPEQICFGGRQRLAVHSLLDGSRIVDCLGRDDSRISFHGIFSGADATARARELDELRVAGQPLPLTWDIFYYTVILDEFEADYKNSWWIPFRIGCTVLRDEAASVLALAESLADILITDLANAFTTASGLGYDLSALQAPLSAPNASVLGSSEYMAAQVALAAGLGRVGGARDSAGTLLDANLFSQATTADMASAGLAGAVSAAQQVAGLTMVKSYLGRASVNLANAST